MAIDISLLGNPTLWMGVAMLEGFVLMLCKDLVKMKLKIMLGKKKGAKFVVGISTDKSIRISAETPVDKKKFEFDGPGDSKFEIPITPKRLFYSPQMGCQAAMIVQGSKVMFDPFEDKMIDPIDGEYMDVAIKKAKMIGEMGAGWLASKEQKMLLVLILIGVGTLIFGFLNMSTGTEVINALNALGAKLAPAGPVAL